MSVTPVRPVRSVTAQARRAQIIAATVEVVAEVGYRQASYARIAAHAGLSSTRLISYHFADKDELVGAVVEDVIGAIGAFVGERVAAAATAADQLRAYLESTVEFIATHRTRMLALLQIVVSGALFSGPSDAAAGAASQLELILRRGQGDGEFRDFDPRVLATVAQRAVEGLPFLLAADPDLDCLAYGRELVTLFELGTRRTA